MGFLTAIIAILWTSIFAYFLSSPLECKSLEGKNHVYLDHTLLCPTWFSACIEWMLNNYLLNESIHQLRWGENQQIITIQVSIIMVTVSQKLLMSQAVYSYIVLLSSYIVPSPYKCHFLISIRTLQGKCHHLHYFRSGNWGCTQFIT